MFGRRRWLFLLGALALLLIVGRFGAGFLTERLWEARVSEAAALVGTRFSLMAAGLEVGGLGLGIAWFLVNFLAATTAVIREYGDLPRPLGHLTERSVLWVVVGVSLVLGVAVAGGTGEWLDPLLVATNGVHFGLADLLLGRDLGFYVSWLPVWELLYHRALGLVLPALIGVTALALLGGTLRVGERRRALVPRARGHFAFLLSLLALVLAAGFLLTPSHLAATRAASLGPAEFLLRTTVARIEAGVALSAALLTVLWGLRARFVLALGGWVGLGLTSLGLALLVQSRASGASPYGPELTPLRRIDSVAFGLGGGDIGARLVVPTLGPSIWDPDPLMRAAETDSAQVVDVIPGEVSVGRRPVRIWYVLRAISGGEVSVLAVGDDRTGPTGGPVSLRWGDSLFSPGLVPYLTLGRFAIRPSAPPYLVGPGAPGVRLADPVRRIAVAWTLQVGSILRARPNDHVAWGLEPVERLRKVAGFIEWGRPRAEVVDRDVLWIVDGFLTAPQFPSSQAVDWRGRRVRLAKAGFVGVVNARDGGTRIFLRPDADSLARAWARIADPLVEASTAIPTPVLRQVGLPREQLAVQIQVVQGPVWSGHPAAPYGRGLYPVQDLAALGTIRDAIAAPFVAESASRVVGLLAGPMAPRSLRTSLELVDSTRAIPGSRELQQRWDRFPFYQQLRDSIRAAGSDFQHGLVRFGLRGDTLLAYQPSYALGPRGRTTLALVNVALGGRLGAGRTYDEAWLNLRGETAPTPVGTEVGARLRQAREWLERADDALRRGDLEEFGRAFGFLRELLRAGTPDPEPPPGG